MVQLTSRTQQPCGTSQRTPLLCRGTRSCVRSTAVRCFKGSSDDNGAKTSAPFRLNFKIPYRVNFGQSMGLVGSGDSLGNWDPKRTVQMKWTDGDWWTVELNVAPGGPLDLEYKYVVVNADGNVGCWKPGTNYRVTLPVGKVSKRVKVSDAWDDSFKKVDVEEAESPTIGISSSNGTPPAPSKPSGPTEQQPTNGRQHVHQQPSEAAATAVATPAVAVPTLPKEPPVQPMTPAQQPARPAAATNGVSAVPPSTQTVASAVPAADAQAPPTQSPPGPAIRPPPGMPPRATSPRSAPPSFAAATTIPVIHPSLMAEQNRLEDGVRNSLEDLQAQMDKHQQLRERTDEAKLAAAEAKAAHWADTAEALTKEVASLRAQLQAVQGLLVGIYHLLAAVLQKLMRQGGDGQQSFPAFGQSVAFQLGRTQGGAQPAIPAESRKLYPLGTMTRRALGAVHVGNLKRLQHMRLLEQATDQSTPATGNGLVQADMQIKSAPIPLVPPITRKQPAYRARSAASYSAAPAQAVATVAQVQVADKPKPLVPVVSGVGRGALQGARGQFDMHAYRQAERARTKVPACIELQAVKREGVWADAAPSRCVTPLEFVQEGGLRGKNWKASIRVLVGEAVGPSIGTFLERAVDGGDA